MSFPNLDSWPDDDVYRALPLLRDDRKDHAQDRLWQRFQYHRSFYCGRAIALGIDDATDFAAVGSIDDINAEVQEWDNPDNDPIIQIHTYALYVSLTVPDPIPSTGWSYWDQIRRVPLDQEPPAANTSESIQYLVTSYLAYLMLTLELEQWLWDMRLIDRPYPINKRRGRPKKGGV